jgi:hypothetical protein
VQINHGKSPSLKVKALTIFHQKTFGVAKAKLLQVKPHPFICIINFINKKVGN